MDTAPHIESMTEKEFRALPEYVSEQWAEPIKNVPWLVILPGSGKKSALHDSGYRIMEVVFPIQVDENTIQLYRTAWCDVIHLDGIGGTGERSVDVAVGSSAARADYEKRWQDGLGFPAGWSIDCLPRSGLLRLFTMSRGINIGIRLSSLEVFSTKKEAGK